MLQPRPTWKQNKEHSLQAYYFQAYIGTWNETSLTYLNKGTKCYGILRPTEFTSNWKNWAGMRGWKINTGKYYKAKRENRSPFPLIVWGVGSSYTTDGLGLRHFIQSFEQQDGLHSGMSNGSSTYVPRVPLLTNHSEKALYGVFPLKKCDKWQKTQWRAMIPSRFCFF